MSNETVSGSSEDHKASSNALFQKRPFVLTIICVLYLFIFVREFIKLITPVGYSAALAELPGWFVLSQLIIFYPIGITSVLGVWFMRRWGLYIFGFLTLLSWTLMVFSLNLLPHIKAVLLSVGFCVTGLIYINRMK